MPQSSCDRQREVLVLNGRKLYLPVWWITTTVPVAPRESRSRMERSASTVLPPPLRIIAASTAHQHLLSIAKMYLQKLTTKAEAQKVFRSNSWIGAGDDDCPFCSRLLSFLQTLAKRWRSLVRLGNLSRAFVSEELYHQSIFTVLVPLKEICNFVC